MIDLYYFMKVQYKGKQVIQSMPKYNISKAWDYKFYYSKEIQRGNYANDQIVVGGSGGDDGLGGCLYISYSRLLRGQSLLYERRGL